MNMGKEVIKKAANDIKYLTQDIKVIISYKGTYFTYNTTTNMYKSPYNYEWFTASGTESFNEFLLDIINVSISPIAKFVPMPFLYSDCDIMVINLKDLKEYFNELNLGYNTGMINSIYKSFDVVEKELNRSMLIDGLKEEIFDFLSDIVDDEDKNSKIKNVDNLSKLTEKIVHFILELQ